MTTERPIGTDRRFRGLLILAIVIATLWFGALSILALLAANPVTVNRDQILHSDAVVIARLADSGNTGPSFSVESVLAGSNVPERVEVQGVSLREIDRDVAYILPLREERRSFAVTTARVSSTGMPLIYQAAPETVETVSRILATQIEKPYP